MSLPGRIGTLISAGAQDPAALVLEAKERMEEYFSADPEEKWNICSPTYRSNTNRTLFLTACEDWFSIVEGAEVLNIGLPSGVMAIASVRIDFGEGYQITRDITLVKERDAYTPDPNSPFSVSANTAPPYIVG